jgi:hypothetical protein
MKTPATSSLPALLAFALLLAPAPGAALDAGAALLPGAALDAEPRAFVQEPACEPSDRMALEGRPSPYDSAAVAIGDASVKLCYGRPSARGRTIIGSAEHHPFGELWRTGANEPTTLHTTGAIEVAGVALEPGSYSIYTRPGEDTWQVYFSRSVDRWGIPITPEVQAQEVGSAEVPRERPPEHVETLTFRFENATDGGADLVLEWEEFRIVLPVQAG